MYDYAKLNRKRFGRRLAIARTKCDLTQDGLAILAASKQAIISRYEAGNATPKDTNMKRLAEMLGEDYNWLKHGAETTAEITEEDNTKTIAIKYIKPEDPEDRTKVIEKINNYFPDLSNDGVQIVFETAKALYLDEHQDKLSEALDQETKIFKEQLRVAGNIHKTSTQIRAARRISLLKTKDPDLYEEYQNDPSKYKEIIMESKKRSLQRNYPTLYKQYEMDPTPEKLEEMFKEADRIISEQIRADREQAGFLDTPQLDRKHADDTFINTLASNPMQFQKIIEVLSRWNDLLIAFILEPTRSTLEMTEHVMNERFENNVEPDEPLEIDETLFDDLHANKIKFSDVITAVSLKLLEVRFPSLFGLLGTDRSEQHIESLVREAKFHL